MNKEIFKLLNKHIFFYPFLNDYIYFFIRKKYYFNLKNNTLEKKK